MLFKIAKFNAFDKWCFTVVYLDQHMVIMASTQKTHTGLTWFPFYNQDLFFSNKQEVNIWRHTGIQIRTVGF